MKVSKYLGLVSGDWTCTHVGVDRVQPAFKVKRDLSGKRVRNKYPGHMSYYYIFERLTHDGKAMKMIRLSAAQANYVLKGKKTVEEYAIKKEELRSQDFVKKVSYSFCD
jgi:hypothetical protein